MEKITVDESACIKCGICTRICPMSLITIAPGSFPKMESIKKLFCINCGQCEAFCPKSALTLSYPEGTKDADQFQSLIIPPNELELYFKNRRSVRNFKKDPVDKAIIESALDIVRYAPSGKNGQPVKWIVIHEASQLAKCKEAFITWSRELAASDSPLKKAMPAATVIKMWESGVDMILRDAPHLIIAYTPDNTMMGKAATTDGVIALTHLDLVLPSFGLGGFWAGFFTIGLMQSALLRETVGIPEGHSISYAYAFGYPQYKTHAFPKRKASDITWL